MWKPQPRIVSTLPGRLELEHIEDMIDGMAIQPDFGYNNTVFQKDMGQRSAWFLLWDFVNNEGKYERVDNFIEARQMEKQEEADAAKKSNAKGARDRETALSARMSN